MELLAPAGNLEKLKTAVLYNTDAVYIGGVMFSLRARANNFTKDELKQAVDFAHLHKKMLYVTMNIIPHNEDLKDLDEYIIYLDKIGVDAIIISSLDLIERVKKLKVKLNIHLSTQLSITNSQAINYLTRLGVKRVVLARECTLLEIENIVKNTNIEIEVFIQGGMCSSYSGRCVLSNYMTNRDANRGGCAHSCRWNYNLIDNKNIYKEFTLGAKDLSIINYIASLKKAGVTSLKIEGRMKSQYYIACMVKTYKEVINKISNNESIDYEYYERELKKVENRDFCRGYIKGFLTKNDQLYNFKDTIANQEFLGIVVDIDKVNNLIKIEQRNYFTEKQEVEFFGPNLNNTLFKLNEIYDENYNRIQTVPHPKQIVYIKCDIDLNKYDIMRISSSVK